MSGKIHFLEVTKHFYSKKILTFLHFFGSFSDIFSLRLDPSSVQTNFTLILVRTTDNAVLQTDGTYLDVDASDPATTAIAVCCGETTSQGCGTNPLSYDYNADQAAWDATLSADEAACNALDSATGKPHAWEILHAR